MGDGAYSQIEQARPQIAYSKTAPRMLAYLFAYSRYPCVSSRIRAYPRVSSHILAYSRVSTAYPRVSAAYRMLAYLPRIYAHMEMVTPPLTLVHTQCRVILTLNRRCCPLEVYHADVNAFETVSIVRFKLSDQAL